MNSIAEKDDKYRAISLMQHLIDSRHQIRVLHRQAVVSIGHCIVIAA
ncbi:hypothetical protein [Psychrobacter urativorans]|nr:hypothetical protein [Psychrobacter urativorans]